MRNGVVRVTIRFPHQISVGRVVVGYHGATGAYFSAGVGGYELAYVLDEHLPGRGWRLVQGRGRAENLVVGVAYKPKVQIRERNVRISANGVCVLENVLPYSLLDEQVGLFAWGSAEVGFEDAE